ncbi:phosphoenolpyruvate--protein phosphotransferase [Tolumonas lignilytica]|uniref:phosphoenolpyruvate--protein phosphotransferase n=1 Tax=Tolumonas lignilytica TaxID=1283284 RepID=UPI000464E1CC|nr:phosphoenolpyruvate--protein phosphotransferase [Tolumonas lignilytica]
MPCHKLEYRCSLQRGLHARPATQLEAVTKGFKATIDWCNRRNGRCANAKSVLALLGTDTLFDDLCDITLTGSDALEAARVLQHFLHYELQEDVGAETELPPQFMPRSLLATKSEWIHGLPVSPGIAQGQLVLFESSLSLPSIALPPETWDLRQRLITTALIQLQQQLELQLTQAQDQTAQVLQAHLALVTDSQFRQILQGALPDAASAAQAILQTQHYFQSQFQRADSHYLRERELDLRDVCQQLLALLYPTWVQESCTLAQASVVLATELTPSQFLRLDKSYLRALLLTHGGATSHTVILARAAGIPVLTRLPETRLRQTVGLPVIVDAELGICLVQPDQIAERYYQLHQQIRQQRQRVLAQQSLSLAWSADRQRLEIAANINSPSEMSQALAAGAEGVGLFRTETLFLERDTPPDEEEQYQAYCALLTAANGKPVIIRTFDLGGDKPLSYLPLSQEANPFLGMRGVRLYPHCEALFRTQLRALLRAAPLGGLKVMLPMVSQLDELIWVRRLVAEEQLALHAAQIPHAAFPLGIMLEIPATALQVPVFCAQADFFSIGSNDLTQYLLAVDRTNPQVAHYYHYAHPALWLLLRQIAEQARLHGCWIGLCGELARERRFLPLLLALGLNEISLVTTQIVECKTQLAQLHAGRCRQLLDQVCECDSSEQVLALLVDSDVYEPRPMLSSDNMILQAAWISKAEVLKGMVDHLWLTGRTAQPYSLEEALWTREETYSTGLGHGIALPHAMSDAIEHPAISICRLTQAVDWGSLDGQPVDLVIMLTLSTRQGKEQHLRIFSRLARKIMYESFRQQLRQAPDGSALCALLQAELKL